jgi:hypothetical protein
MGIADFCVECGELLQNGKCPLCSDPKHAQKIIAGEIDKTPEEGTSWTERYGLPIGLRSDARRRGKGQSET